MSIKSVLFGNKKII